MDPRVEKLKTPAECETFIANAQARDRNDLAQEARRRSIELCVQAHATNSPLERECLQAAYANEEAVASQQGRKSKPSRVSTAIKRDGALAAVDRIARKADDAQYAALSELGLETLAAEAVVLRHPAEFSFEAVERSKARVSRREKPPG
jgi:hypothetical protein